ncbi:MAG TPA: hypothetical protein EYQ24_04655 [Bacteroidetes bacterium]|nr:hypothetical protein [Bacteroidota bacterium]HIL57364.1 hypothetical protein [Rhodothermales bacterium]
MEGSDPGSGAARGHRSRCRPRPPAGGHGPAPCSDRGAPGPRQGSARRPAHLYGGATRDRRPTGWWWFRCPPYGGRARSDLRIARRTRL